MRQSILCFLTIVCILLVRCSDESSDLPTNTPDITASDTAAPDTPAPDTTVPDTTSPSANALSVEVCFQEKYPSAIYPHATTDRTVGISMRAFGIEPGQSVDVWRNRSLEELAALFEAYIVELGITGADHYMLDFEKEWSNTFEENRGGIERSVAAVRSVEPNAVVSLYGTPFPVGQNGRLNAAYSDPDYLAWVRSLGVHYIPVLYISFRNGVFPTLEEIEANTELLLSVFPPEESTPYLWHKWNAEGNWQTNPEIIEEFPNLEPLRVQLEVLERLGFDRICFWHGDDDPAIAQTLEILFDE